MIDGADADRGVADYRGDEGLPEPADDVDVSYARQAERTDDDRPAKAEKADAERPPLVKDTARANIAARFKNRRVDYRAGAVPRSHVPAVDGDITDPNDPDYIASDADQTAPEGSVDRQPRVETSEDDDAGTQSPPSRGHQSPYTLTVYGNQIIARDRGELARLAEVDEDEADTIPDAALIRLAQKQLAARQALDEAKEFQKRARMTGGAPSATPADDDPPEPSEARTPTPGRRPAPNAVDMVRELQYGDPEEVAVRVEDTIGQMVEQRIAQREIHSAVDRIRTDVASTLDRIGQANADLAAIPEASDLIAVKTTRLIVDELRKCGITDAEAQELSVNPRMATDAFVGAKALPQFRGKLREIGEIAQTAVSDVRRTFGLATKPGAPSQQPGAVPSQPQTRRDMKRALIQQPARTGAQLPTELPMERDDARKSRSSQAIAKMRAARHQG